MRVGIVDDDLSLAKMLAGELEPECEISDDPSAALDWVREGRVDCLFTDLKMPEKSGLELLDEIKQVDRDFPVVVLTGHGSVETAVEAMKRGARDYLEKPLNVDEISVLLERISEQLKRDTQLQGFRESQRELLAEEKLVGESPEMNELRQLIDRVAGSDTSVLVQGETGTGKELVARALHNGSPRRDAPFMVINCAAIPRELLESELFGHEKGAFTGAKKTKKGKVELADGGSLFLDEIGELPVSLQPKLLRVLEQQELTRVGGDFPVGVDVRVITATNRNLDELVESDKFRKDLYYRINTIQISAPPLREHPEDIPLLIEHFGSGRGREEGGLRFTEPALCALKTYSWPGNVRELKNLVERMEVLKPGGDVDTSDLPPEIVDSAGPNGSKQFDWRSYGESLNEALEALESKIIRETLEANDGNVAAAARELGLSRQSLHYKIDQRDE